MRRAPLAFLVPLLAAAACGAEKPAIVSPPRPDASVHPAPIADAGAEAAAASRPSKVVVAIVVDQLAAWAALERIPALPANGGFQRLIHEGTWVEEMRYLHAQTDTAPGHAALFTGAVPRDSGIFGNEVVEEATGKRRSILRDTSTKLLLGGDGPGSSLAALRVETVADRLRAADPQAVIVALSLKDRGALFGAGRRPDLALWYDSKGGRFVTSSAVYAEANPVGLAREVPVRVLARAGIAEHEAWRPLDEAWVAKHARVPDDQRGEGDLLGLGTTFPHPPAKETKWGPATARATPAGDRALVRLAVAALPYASVGHPFLLALSFSSHDYVGHVFGPDSWEALDELYRLDAELASLFTALDVQFGPHGWSAILSGDHGSTPLIETPLAARPWCAPGVKDRFERPCAGGERLLMDATAKELDAAAVKALGPGRWIAGLAEPWVYLTQKARELPKDKRALLDRTVERTLVTGHPKAVARVVRFAKIEGACPEGESLDALLCRAAPPGQEDAYYVLVKPGSMFDPDYTPNEGSSHGSPYLHDRTVPLLVRGGGAATDRVVPGPIDYRAYARTLSALLGLEPPAAAAGGTDLTAAP